MERTKRSLALTVSKESIFILLTVASAVVLPQIFHELGAFLGIGGKLGQIFLPMYIPVLILGFYRGVAPGAITGLLAPLVSFAITGMPTEALLPYVTFELIATGVFAGLLRDVRVPAVLRIFTVQVMAKAARLSMLAANIYFYEEGAVTYERLSAGIAQSLPGIILQLVLVGCLLKERDDAR